MPKVIRPYDANWPLLFEAEAQVLQRILGQALLALHHIGSTAVPGMVAKPVIDILAEARSLNHIDRETRAMEAGGYEARGAYGIEGRRYFNKPPAGPGAVGFHVHAFAAGSPHLGRHIRFRDHLIASPEAAHEYAAVKLSLCDANGVLVSDYAERKAPFIERINHRLDWTEEAS